MNNAVESEKLEQLVERHSTLDGQLKVLARRAHLTPTERRTETELKKQKLLAKDLIFAMRSS